jgi:hypothetical protein
VVETGTIACIVIAGEGREKLLDELVMPSVLGQSFDEVVVVGSYKSGEGYRHLPVPPITRTTIDALIKRDVGTVATKSDTIVFLCDDHRLDPFFGVALRDVCLGHAFGVPTRITNRGPQTVYLNTGFRDGYCGGHAGVFPRSAVQLVPWSIAPHHPNWDVLHSHMLIERGYELVELPGCLIEDVEGKTPWR